MPLILRGRRKLISVSSRPAKATIVRLCLKNKENKNKKKNHTCVIRQIREKFKNITCNKTRNFY